MNHQFVQHREDDDRCVVQHVEVVRCSGGGKFTVSTPCLKPRAEHDLK